MSDQQHGRIPVGRAKIRRLAGKRRKEASTGSIVTLPPIIRVAHPVSMPLESNYCVRAVLVIEEAQCW